MDGWVVEKPREPAEHKQKIVMHRMILHFNFWLLYFSFPCFCILAKLIKPLLKTLKSSWQKMTYLPSLPRWLWWDISWRDKHLSFFQTHTHTNKKKRKQLQVIQPPYPLHHLSGGAIRRPLRPVISHHSSKYPPTSYPEVATWKGHKSDFRGWLARAKPECMLACLLVAAWRSLVSWSVGTKARRWFIHPRESALDGKIRQAISYSLDRRVLMLAGIAP